MNTTVSKQSAARRLPAWLATGLLASLLALSFGGTAFAASSVDFQIVTPKADATVASPVQLKVAVEGAEIGKPSAGKDHLHVSVDGGPSESIYSAEDISMDLQPGEHTIEVEIAGPTHKPLLPPKHVTFTVE